uniref:Uncharacterized protein n=1 Tax=Brassica oleracea TaxID=3712 RepID=A0A3P6FTD6_BRAOL|nr:unnamed protein product [Brassica oleracea]
MLLPPPKLQAIASRVFIIGDYVVCDVNHEVARVIRVHGYFVNSWESLLDWGATACVV